MIPSRVLVSLRQNDAEASSGSSDLICRALALPVGNKTMVEFWPHDAEVIGSLLHL